MPAADFNNDEVYQRLTTEAIKAKTLALQKIRICAHQVQKGEAKQSIQLFLDQPLEVFASQFVELEVKTGLFDFPWKEVLGKEGTLKLGRWRAEGIEPDKLFLVSEELAKNTNLRLVMLDDYSGKPLSLPLPEGWASKKLNWINPPMVQQSPALAVLLLKNCVLLENLNLRYAATAPTYCQIKCCSAINFNNS